MLLNGKTIINAVASSGIGATVAKIFAVEGEKLVPGARRAQLLEQVVNEISVGRCEAVFVAGMLEGADTQPNSCNAQKRVLVASTVRSTTPV
ncbi:hypothetical protein SLH49_21230 [Cognatiyoonia sp. IB215446]|uniref:hypothetical protein n=1 Tax=Cognatiyoonia sp. IB215446 TaxID=3097355 RepID=UPI002A141A72|nr:hypothetical protein [Cognatiyoonia sp. IB215446]MDX8350521.1 hypothetical protein [Cognatiyoonia sp. IB215446]